MSRCALFMLVLLIGTLAGCGCQSSSQAGDVAPAAAPVATTDPTRTAAFQRAEAQHLRGVDGDLGAARTAYDTFTALHESHPDNPLLTAYLGSATLLRSRDETLPWNKGKYARRGVTLLNQAVDAAPENVGVRLVRAASTAGLPGMFKLQDQHRADVQWLVEQLQSTTGGEIRSAEAAQIAFMKGNLRQDAGLTDEARRWWQQAVELAPDSRAGRRAAGALSN